MKKKRSNYSVFIAAISLLLLIFDGKTAVMSVHEGIELCLKVVIPSLFPFLIVTTYLNAAILSTNIPGAKYLGRLLQMPKGAESVLLLGLLGGYPVGAQLIADRYQSKQLDQRTAQIMMGYCSNAGPAFIFGVAGALFASAVFPAVLWGIHIFSALLTGFLLPKPVGGTNPYQEFTDISLSKSLKKSMSISASICGWIITFKIILAYIMKWIQYLPVGDGKILIAGFLELSNGCLELNQIDSVPYRFILCSIFLAFGGLCVILQTKTVTEPLGFGLYIPGKVIQSCISLITAWLLCNFLFPDYKLPTQITILSIFAVFVILIFIIISKKVVEIHGNIMYNSFSS